MDNWKLVGKKHIEVSYFIDLCKAMTNITIAITTSQPERPNERLSIIVGNDENWETKLGMEFP